MNIRRLGVGALCAILLGGTAALGQAAGLDERSVRSWAASCAACHGTDGRAIAGSTALAGRDGEDLYQLLIEFKTGERPATVMHQHAKGYSDAELRALANWFAAQPRR
ncbi:c-type cytochrome [Ectothiorhodospira lacustris]|uniref:c-type cytochrome n=1 Tax=Ectothiorhodospira lacustris TaxID=2899127 RepID=UPI001EE86819|nr:c-type cytochrome [Ectothiorhodospira lacustris]MCG5501983.1 cytochrome C, class I [Ectothiorhodospira lacustris]